MAARFLPLGHPETGPEASGEGNTGSAKLQRVPVIARPPDCPFSRSSAVRHVDGLAGTRGPTRARPPEVAVAHSQTAAAETVAELVLARAGDRRPGLVTAERTYSHAEVVAQAAARAAWLGEHRRPGPFHVAVLLDNIADYVCWLQAAALAGAVVVGGNPTHRGDELARDLAHTECQLLVTSREYLPLVDGRHLGRPPWARSTPPASGCWWSTTRVRRPPSTPTPAPPRRTPRPRGHPGHPRVPPVHLGHLGRPQGLPVHPGPAGPDRVGWWPRCSPSAPMTSATCRCHYSTPTP